MKFNKNLKLFFCLIIFMSSNLAYSLNIKRNISFEEDKFFEGLSKECSEEQDNSEYNECMEEITGENYKQVCSTFNSEKCQKFFNNPLDYFPICKDDPKIKEYYQPSIMNYFTIHYGLICLTDENDNLCPFGLAVITKSGANEFVEDTCKSEKCTHSTIELCKKVTTDNLLSVESSSLTNGSYTYDELNSYKNVIKKLESDECRTQHVTSNANTIKNNSLLISLLLLLLLLLK
ncbi:hypothetical protein BCR32DRAFT_251565 [Anaeromyces robustus]|uniref:Uncharacterized protein n=1 Tax=Anaeromyces robustus TaxID=1754192 RepID=A0A1Y1VQ84_9FUNG|nr:hypothetical protein BCR32DRAFT_251565 [Anaeromyces robustus]|eukprot:ORX63472.1 hypothetical protein BCR32DRAFT_251565 [Anaeromyces robustus]